MTAKLNNFPFYSNQFRFSRLLKNMFRSIAFSLCFLICFTGESQAQFTGHSGVYYLTIANSPAPLIVYNNPNISGVAVRFRWQSIEPSPGNFDWSYVDGEIAKAAANNKKVCLQALSVPDWMDSLGATQYYYIDKNTYHSTYGQAVAKIIPWDSVYIERYKILLDKLAEKYANDTTVAYINTVGGAFSRGMPDSVVTDTALLTTAPFWVAHNYNADTLGGIINEMTDYYMSLFPNTHLWCSVDYVSFQTKATGQPRNYLASIYTNYGVNNYPSRFGLWREDLAGCNPNLSNISTGSQWHIMQQHYCRTGAQMLWNVQDGPTRMNKCGIVPNTKAAVLDSAVNKGIALGMRYLEIYSSDITDASLSSTIQNANNALKRISCPLSTLTSTKSHDEEPAFSFYPNPVTDILTIDFKTDQATSVQVFNATGVLIREVAVASKAQLDVSDLQSGLYIIRVNDSLDKGMKFIKE